MRAVCQTRPVCRTFAGDLLDKGARNTALSCQQFLHVQDADCHSVTRITITRGLLNWDLSLCSCTLSPEPAAGDHQSQGSGVVPGSASRGPGSGGTLGWPGLWGLILSAVWQCDSPAGGPGGSAQEPGSACCGRAWDKLHSLAGEEQCDGNKQR